MISINLRDRWVISGHQDFSIYRDEIYIFDLVDCYLKFTRGCIHKARQILPQVNSILDYYNGVGLSTIQAMLEWEGAEIFYWTDVGMQEKWMIEYCRRFRIDHSRIKKDNGGSYEAVFLFEVLEHYKEPEDFFLNNIHGRVQKYLVWASPFSEMWAGHFPRYHNVDSKKYKRRFKKFLNDLGYSEIYNGYNERPLLSENKNLHPVV
jgi:hypothetical protein